MKPISSSGPVYSTGIVSSLSPVSEMEEWTFSSPGRTARGSRANVRRRTAPHVRCAARISSRADSDAVRVVLGQHALVIREIPGQLAAHQQPVAELEEQMIVVAGKARSACRLASPASFRISRIAFLGSSAWKVRFTTSEVHASVQHRQAVTVGRHHHQAVVLAAAAARHSA